MFYFTIPLKPNGNNLDNNKKTKVYLGHAVGKNIDSLEMTEPVLRDFTCGQKKFPLLQKIKKDSDTTFLNPENVKMA